jgi:hypothetical protein
VTYSSNVRGRDELSSKRALLAFALSLTVAGCGLLVVSCASSPSAQRDAVTSVAPSPASTDPRLSADEADLLAEVERIRVGLRDGTLVFDYSAGPDSDLPSDPQDLLDMVEYAAYRPDITVYFKTEPASQEPSLSQMTALRDELAAMPEVAKATYVSKEEALAQVKEQYPDRPEMWESLPANPLPAYLEIWLRDYHQSSEIAVELQRRPLVDEVRASSRSDIAGLLALVRSITRSR